MIINLAMKSHRFPKISLLVVTATCLLAVNSLASDKTKPAPPVKPANQYAAFEVHPKEQATVAAEPCNEPRDCDFFRLPDFGFNSTTVKPHSTLAGYLFYDVRQLDEYPLKGAELFVKMVYTAPDKDGNKKQLFDFNIPFDKWLAARSGQKSSGQRSEANPKP
jgi:hypothetical protein